MSTRDEPAEAQRVFCEICLKDIPRSEAAVSEARDYVAYFCGLDCYEKWSQQSAQRAAPAERNVPGETEPELQQGHGRSNLKDELLKRKVRSDDDRA